MKLVHGKELDLILDEEGQVGAVEEVNAEFCTQVFYKTYRGIGAAAADPNMGFISNENNKLAEEEVAIGIYFVAVRAPLGRKFVEERLDLQRFCQGKLPAALVDPHPAVRRKIFR